MNPASERSVDATQGCFVTGTDTGVGKTLCSIGLIHALRAHGLNAAGMKPLAAGAHLIDGRLRNDDAVALREASYPRPTHDQVNPILLREPTAPEIASDLEGVRPGPEQVDPAWRSLCDGHDFVVVEGAGGWLSPLGSNWMQSDLAIRYRLPVVLVVGLRLGCINHALLSARAIRADGLELRGWLRSDVDPALAHAEAYAAQLEHRLDIPLLGRLPHGANPAETGPRWHIAPLIPELTNAPT